MPAGQPRSGRPGAPRRLRVLFLCTRLPAPPRRGDQVRSFHLLRELAARHDITCVVAPLGRRRAEDLAASRELGVELVVQPVDVLDLARAGLRAACGGDPVQSLIHAGRSARRVVRELLGTGNFDLVHAQLVRAAALLPAASPPLVLDLVDALSANTRRRAAFGGVLAPLLTLEAARLDRRERSLLQRAVAALVVSQADRDALGGDARLHVIPNGVDLETFAWQEGPREGGRIVFAGNLGYFPNVDAACRLATRILPEIRRERPGIELRLAGARPARAVRRLAGRNGVTLAADVPSLAVELAQATITVIPMRAGSGMQNKILEAMAVGTPVVTTPAAAAACGARPGIEVLVAEDDAGLARAALSLLADPSFARSIARAARHHVESQPDWAAAARAIEALWRAAASDEGDAPGMLSARGLAERRR